MKKTDEMMNQIHKYFGSDLLNITPSLLYAIVDFVIKSNNHISKENMINALVCNKPLKEIELQALCIMKDFVGISLIKDILLHYRNDTHLSILVTAVMCDDIYLIDYLLHADKDIEQLAIFYMAVRDGLDATPFINGNADFYAEIIREKDGFMN